MIIKDYIRDFEELAFGMFVHWGVYSVHAKGEWAYHNGTISKEDYYRLIDKFNPELDWADQLVSTAKKVGCKYITLTTRHHDGYSLYDTKGLNNNFDAFHTGPKRDLVREFVDACRKYEIVPFFYHTLLDWTKEEYDADFKAYLKYLRDSIEVLCTNYGPIGGFWFDGQWNKRDADWELDELYGIIRKHQPKAMIINNSGLAFQGQATHEELDAVTFERGRPDDTSCNDGKYRAKEMCQIFGNYWGYAKNALGYKSMDEIIGDYGICRRYGANYLINVGPMGNGYISPIEKAMLEVLGQWNNINSEALYLARPCGIKVENKDKDFVLKHDNNYYLFMYDLCAKGDFNVMKYVEDPEYNIKFKLKDKIKKVTLLESGYDELVGGELQFSQNGEDVIIYSRPQPYGELLPIKVCKIQTE